MSKGKEVDNSALEKLFKLVGPKGKDETTEEFYIRYGRLNDGLAAKLANEPPVHLIEADFGNQGMSCTVCGMRGPSASTIYEAARKAQAVGFWRDNKNASWFCPSHIPPQQRQQNGGQS